jgi:hypothetical protein
MIVYHGTSKQQWKPNSNHGYYVSETLSHAFYHAHERANETDSMPIIVQIDTERLSNDFEYLPDNDCHEMDGYETWTDSLKDKGSFILKGNTNNILTSKPTTPFESENLFINHEGDIVELLPENATNNYGDVLRWVKCINGNDVSIWEKEFKSTFLRVA